jgi:hypothetical protein
VGAAAGGDVIACDAAAGAGSEAAGTEGVAVTVCESDFVVTASESDFAVLAEGSLVTPRSLFADAPLVEREA